MAGQFDSLEQLIECAKRRPLQGSRLFRDKTDEWDDRRPGDVCGSQSIGSSFSSSVIPNEAGQSNFMQILCHNCGKPLDKGVNRYCYDCACCLGIRGTVFNSEHLKGSNIHCSECQEYQANQKYPWGGNTPIMSEEITETCKNNSWGIHEIGSKGQCSECKKFNESKQITSDNLKGGFKAASGKASFDLLPVYILRDFLENYLVSSVKIEESYCNLIDRMLKFWEENNLAALQDAEYIVFELLSKQTGGDIEALFAIGELYAIGAKKYSNRNWEKGIDWGIVWSAAMRHLLNHINGELNDPVDGQLHLTSVCWNIIALIHFNKYPDKYKQFDSRDEIIVAQNKGQK